MNGVAATLPELWVCCMDGMNKWSLLNPPSHLEEWDWNLGWMKWQEEWWFLRERLGSPSSSSRRAVRNETSKLCHWSYCTVWYNAWIVFQLNVFLWSVFQCCPSSSRRRAVRNETSKLLMAHFAVEHTTQLGAICFSNVFYWIVFQLNVFFWSVFKCSSLCRRCPACLPAASFPPLIAPALHQSNPVHHTNPIQSSTFHQSIPIQCFSPIQSSPVLFTNPILHVIQ